MLLPDYKEAVADLIEHYDKELGVKGQYIAICNRPDILAPIQELEKLAQLFCVEEIAAPIYLSPAFRIMTGSGASNLHHYGLGGLARHTYEVVNACLKTAALFPQYKEELRLDEVYLAALFHDAGKVEDYTDTISATAAQADLATAFEHTTWIKTPHARRIHHICKSAILWSKAVDMQGTSRYKDMHDSVLHAIIAHHAWREWGSPCAPDTRLAWLLHLCDSLSARLNDCLLSKTGEVAK